MAPVAAGRVRAGRVRAGVAAMAVFTMLAGCGTGKDAVDPQAGGAQRFVAGPGTVSEYPPAERKAAPAISGELLGGGRFALADRRGTVVVVNFWGSWCAPCRAEADDLEAVYQHTRADGVEFVGVNVRDAADRAAAFNRTFGVSYPSLFDPAHRVALRFRDTPPNAIPATIVIDRAGRVAVVFRKPLLREQLLPVVERIAAERP